MLFTRKRTSLYLALAVTLLLLVIGIGKPAAAASSDLIITGVIDGPLAGGTPKAVEFYVLNDIADLSIYGFGSANNGGGTDGEEFTFPSGTATAGDYIYVATESTEFANWFGFAPDYTNGNAPNINGDDAIELFQSGVVVDVFGDINVDGTGEPWEHLDGWAYRVSGTGPDGSTFVLANWTFSGPNALDGETTNATAATPFPLGTFGTPPVPTSDLVITGVIDGPLAGGTPKAVEFYVLNDIADLSIYGFGSANNGGGTDGEEFTFPSGTATAGDYIYVATESTEFANWFGFAPDYTNGNAPNINGDDAIELFQSGVVVDVFGDINVDGTGEPWEHLDGWAYRVSGTGPDGSTFVLANWTFSGPNALDGETTNATAATPFPLGTFGTPPVPTSDLVITGMIDGPLAGGTPKAVEFYVLNDIADLSIYGFGSANNGGGTDGEEFTFPSGTATAGDYIYVATESTEFANWFGFAPDYTNGNAPNINGDDAIELFQSGVVVDVFGDINVDGTGEPWEHLDGWAYRVSGTGPDGSTFVLANWTFSGPNALDGETTNATAATPFPLGTYDPSDADAPPSVSSTTPANNATNVALDASININFSEDVTVNGAWFNINCTASGAHPAVVSGGAQNYVLDPDVDFSITETCTVNVIATEVSDVDADDPPDNMDQDYSFSFSTLTPQCGLPATPIHDIQGNGASSPLVGQTHTIEAVVVATFQGADQIGGYFVQEEDVDADANALTSEGLRVFDNTNTPNVGDVVRIQGTIAEYFDRTELNNIANYEVCGTGIATEATLSLPVTSTDDFEAYEGMLVTFPQPLVISEYFNFDRFGEIVSDLRASYHANGRIRARSPDAIAAAQDFLLDKITLDDGRTNQNPDPAIHPNGT